MNEKEERREFEQWASMPPREWPIDRNMNWAEMCLGGYCDRRTSIAWQAWQARADVTTHKALYED